VGLERGPLSLVRIIEELLEWKSSGSCLENRINCRKDPLQVKEDEMGRAYSTNGGEEECI
jgi:hypothetical protein